MFESDRHSHQQQHPQQEMAGPGVEPWLLAHNPEVGTIFRCNNCRNIHLVLGPANLQVAPETFLAVVDLIQRGAANFELMLEVERESECD